MRSARKHFVGVAGSLLVLTFGLGACGSDAAGGGGGGGSRTFYVRASGNDDAAGTSAGRALATPQEAVARARPGDVVIVGPGTYVRTSERTRAVIQIAGFQASLERPLLVVADREGQATGDQPGPVVLDASGDLFGVRLTAASGVVIDGFVIANTDGGNAAGIQIASGSQDVTVRHTIVRDHAFDGIRVDASSRVLLFNNLVRDNRKRGIFITGGDRGSSGVRIINNTVARNLEDGISIRPGSVNDQNGVHSLFLRNNLVMENGFRGIDAARGTTLGYDADYNLIFPATRAGVPIAYGPDTPRGRHDLTMDPLVVGDYRLAHRATGHELDSPAVDAGDPGLDEALRSALHERTTRLDDELDNGVVDIGFHHHSPLPPPPTPTPPGVTTPGTPTATPTTTPTPEPIGPRLFVRASGADANDGSSPATALQTIQRAVQNALPGAVIYVGPGEYRESITIASSGFEHERIVLSADPTGTMTGDEPGEVIITSGANVPAIFVNRASYWTIEGFTITDSSIGIHVRRESRGVVLRHNEIYGNTADAIRLQDAPGVTVFNNLMYCNLRRGLLVAGSSSGSPGARVVNNTIVANGDRGIFIGTNTVASGNAYMRNNLIQDNCGNNIQVIPSSLQGYDAQYNLVSPPSYFGAIVHPTDTAFDPASLEGVARPARFVQRAFCETICRTPGRSPQDFPTTPTIERHPNDFRLAQVIAGQDPPDSTGVDAGDPALPSEYSVPLRRRTTASNDEADAGRIDIGFHFPVWNDLLSPP